MTFLKIIYVLICEVFKYLGHFCVVLTFFFKQNIKGIRQKVTRNPARKKYINNTFIRTVNEFLFLLSCILWLVLILKICT